MPLSGNMDLHRLTGADGQIAFDPDSSDRPLKSFAKAFERFRGATFDLRHWQSSHRCTSAGGGINAPNRFASHRYIVSEDRFPFERNLRTPWWHTRRGNRTAVSFLFLTSLFHAIHFFWEFDVFCCALQFLVANISHTEGRDATNKAEFRSPKSVMSMAGMPGMAAKADEPSMQEKDWRTAQSWSWLVKSDLSFRS